MANSQSRLTTPHRAGPARFLLLCLLCLPHAAAHAAAHAALQTQCGWLHNPSPGNIWLTTATGTWWLEKQGEEIDSGLESLPSFPPGQWRADPRGYGYGCACVRAEFDGRHPQLRHLHAIQPRRLAACRKIAP